MKRRELMIWTPDGVWLQTGAEDGALRLSHCGVIPLDEVKGFCGRIRLWLEVRIPGQEARWFCPDGDEIPPAQLPRWQRSISRRLAHVTQNDTD